MSENKIYEITQMMSDGRVIQGDVNHAAGMIKSMLNEKYVAPFARAISVENARSRKNPGKEARLLEAIKPFVDTRRHDALERAIDALHTMETLRGLNKQMPRPVYQAQTPPQTLRRTEGDFVQDASVREDGVYDVDDRCMGFRGQPTLMPLLMFMAMAAANGKMI